MILRRFFKVQATGCKILTGDNLKVVWARFSTLSKAALLDNNINVPGTYGLHSDDSRVVIYALREQ